MDIQFLPVNKRFQSQGWDLYNLRCLFTISLGMIPSGFSPTDGNCAFGEVDS
jgi:hypothetical protein